MMNLQSLAVIFIIIVLPISLVLQVYTQSQIDTLNLQISYDSKLKDSTYDAIKAFQLNTINSSTSDLANSKMRDLEASVNAFFTSVATNFNVQGYNASTLQDYVPALVYTLYDGYYIYSPYTNTLKNNESNDNSTYKDEEKLYGLKPYIYYSCEYTRGNDNFVITYSLDNYITIQGYISGNWVNDAGYLISGITYDDSTITYRKCNINKNQSLMEEYVGQKLYSYLKINGVKYYYVNGEKITNKVEKIGKYTYCFDKTGKLVTNKPYYKVNAKTYYKIKKNGQATKLSAVETMAAVRLQKCKGNLKKAFNWSVSLQYAGNVKVSKKTPTEYGLYGFKTGSGDCYVMAATFYWMAKVAGYDAHYVKGYFQKSGGKKGAHAWVEIDQKVNGKKKTYVYDPNFQKEYKLNGYKLTYGAKRTLKYVNYKRVN